MASIRRTLSPVPRPGTSLGGETCSVSSPLSKSSACTHNYPPSNVFSSSSLSSLDYLVYRVQAFALSLFSKRPSRPLDRPKSKGQTWKSVLLHFFICFMVGVFIGLTPLISTNFSTNLMSKNQVFSFEVISPIGKAHIYDVMPKNMTPLLQSQTMNHNATLEPNLMKRELMNGFSDESFVTLPLSQGSDMVLQKLLIVVTTTYVRPFQAYYMTRLADTLKLVPPPLLWIVVDMESQFAETSDILRRTGVVYRHLVCKMNSSGVKDRGVHQRNVALSHIEIHRLDGIVYFADDENIYSADLFEQMRQISLFGTWMVTKLTEGNSEPNLEGPICNGTQVIGWHTNEMTRIPRRFHAEISGFAFNSTTLWDSKRWHRPTLEPIRQLDTVKEGFRVSAFIEQIVEDESQMECFPQDSSRIMVWNLHVESSYSYPSEWFMKHNLDAIAPLA